MTNCIDCGKETAGGLRCKKCHGDYLRRQSLEETRERDEELLAMVAREHLSQRRLAVRLGISPARIGQKLAEARRRQEARKALQG